MKNIAEFKRDVCLMEITLEQAVPRIDYEDVLGKDYVFADEAEVLLPPGISVTKISTGKAGGEEAERGFGSETIKYRVALGGMRFEVGMERSPEELREALDEGAEEAARVLDDFRNNPSQARSADESNEACGKYVEWKSAFQALLAHEMLEIWNSCIGAEA